MKKSKTLQRINQDNQLSNNMLSRIYGGDYQSTVIVNPDSNQSDVWDTSSGDVDKDYYGPMYPPSQATQK